MNTIPASRRDFLKMSALSGTALVIGVTTSPADIRASALGYAEEPSAGEHELTPFIVIDDKGAVTLFNPRPDMGQGSWQALPAILAEELEVSLDAVTITQTAGDRKHGSQNAGGSSSVRGLWKPLRTAGAAAREMLIGAAAAMWGVPVAECFAHNGEVIHRPSGKKSTYGALAAKASTLPVPKEPRLKDPKDFTILGKPGMRPDIPGKTDGSAKFGIDAGAGGAIPGMLYASIERCPTILGSVVKFDDTVAKQNKAVKHVLKSVRPLFGAKPEGVAVLATDYYSAMKARKALKITWETAKYETVDTDTLYKAMHKLAAADGVRSPHSRGDASAALGKAAKVLEARYETPFAAHAAMEPENVVARFTSNKDKGDSVEIWAPTQGIPWTKQAVAREFGLKPENITVHAMFLGGSFGRKGGVDDFVLEAVHLSKAVNAPVKLIWTREDDILQGPFRPGGISVMQAALDADGKVTAFRHKVIIPSIQHQFSPLPADKIDDWTVEGLEPDGSPYTFPVMEVRFSRVETHIPVMWWRSVYPSTTMFGHECFIDELAVSAGKDPLDFRLASLDTAKPVGKRFEGVLRALKEKSGYTSAKPHDGKGCGIAIARSFETICAHAVTVGRGKDGKLRVEKVVAVIDCGMHVNTDNVKAQTEGNIIMGLSAALKDAITFKNGRAEQSNFDTYRVLRIDETPIIEVHVMPSSEAPGGVGEPGLPPLAPALANAVFAATGKRIRTLPFAIDAV